MHDPTEGKSYVTMFNRLNYGFLGDMQVHKLKTGSLAGSKLIEYSGFWNAFFEARVVNCIPATKFTSLCI